MKTLRSLVVILTICIAAAATGHADDLTLLSGGFSGVMLQPATDAQGHDITSSKPITKKLLLVAFGFSGIDPAKTTYALDLNNNTFVLASTNGSTIYGTVITNISSSAHWSVSKPRRATFYGESIAMLNNSLNGTETSSSGLASTGIYTGHFIVAGSLNAVDTALVGSFHLKEK